MVTASESAARTRGELAPAAALFHGLSDPTRLSIVQRLTAGEARVVDLTALLGMAQSTVSAHLACLRDCDLVVARPEGRQMFYSLAHPEVLDVLASAQVLLGVTGNGMDLRPAGGSDVPAAGGEVA
ncbi:putative transcriptional regulator, ArsR family protein [Streptomyces camponoticapitis]|uniref:Transcriptional regulator, ArsR family protein n=1 Tax=Streptomyces camponoticapitis TaxID=1616125 RepID=A0ABQ2E1A0_9ACTN|nr:metalloregulator ArsR/SmtB family transcription factor [Streptomyces camponoticapitis]GGJ86699.1 putative transcriptional regulator, ArsR family protein [Streptomyces camponoticapitis]